jgi:hypothetical protein
MSVKYFKSGGTTWASANSWSATGSGGADNDGAPTAADEVVFQVGSGACSIGAAAVCRSLEMSAYANTLSHGAYVLTIGDGTAPTGGVALVLGGTYTPNASSSIIFTSTGAGVHTINTGGKTIQAITFNSLATASYQFITNNVTLNGLLTHQKSTLDFNGLVFNILGYSNVNNTTSIVSFGSSIITCTGTGSQGVYITGTNFTINANTATFILTGASPTISLADSTNLNGSSFKFTGGAGTATISNTCTIANLIIDPTTTKTFAVTSDKTVTLTGSMYCYPTAGVVTLTGGSISKASGIVNLYQIVSNTITFTGGATWNLCNNCTATQGGTSGLTRGNAFNYIDDVNGSDSFYIGYGFYKVAYTGATGTCPVFEEVMHGETSGSTAKVSVVNPYEWSIGAGTMYFSSKSAAFVSETVHGNTGDGHMTIAADFVNAAWKTINLGALAARIGPGDINRIAESPAPSASIGNCTWQNCRSGGGFATAGTITAMANAGGLIRLTVTAHGFVNNDVIQVIGLVTTGTSYEANGAWLITKNDNDTFDLVGSVYVNTRAIGGTAQKITSKAVILDASKTLTIDRCENVWTSGTGTASLVQVTTDAKEGNGCAKVIASANANARQAYKATGSIAGATMNNYQKLTFWIKNEVAIADATTWAIVLCSDTAGANPIDVFPVQAIPSTGFWVPLTVVRSYYTLAYTLGNGTTPVVGATLTSGSSTAKLISLTTTGGSWAGGDASGVFCLCIKTGVFASGEVSISGSDHCHIAGDMVAVTGGNLGGDTSIAVQSIALYSGATAPTVKYVYLDNFEACTTAGISLQSLISKNGYEQSSLADVNHAEAWYGIQSISQRVVLLDNIVNTKSNAGLGYSNAEAVNSSESVATYIRETIKTSMAATATATVNELLDNGTFNDGNIQYQGGYDLTTGAQTGVTIYDGLNGVGIGIYSNTKAYLTINYVSVVRYTHGFIVSGCDNIQIINICDTNNCSGYGIYPNSSNSNLNIINIINTVNNDTAIYITSALNISITRINNGSNNLTRVIYYTNSILLFIQNLIGRNNSYVFRSFSASNFKIDNYISANNSTSSFSSGSGQALIQNATISETPNSSATAFVDSRVFINKLASTGYSRVETDSAYMISQAATAGGTGIEWVIYITGVNRHSNYPFKQIVGKIYVEANDTVTVSLYIKKSHATEIAAKLFCRGGQLTNIAADVSTTAPSDTVRNNVTLAAMTPTEGGVLEIECWAWWVSGLADETVIFDDITITYS